MADSTLAKATALPAMHYRRFGRTNLKMSVFSCGGMRYQQSWQDVSAKEIEAKKQANLEACIHRALEVGINHIETARGYGTSEMQLGRILPGLPREKLIVQTKIGPKETATEFMEVFETSMQNLKLDYVDLLGIHGINTQDLLETTLRPGGMMTAVRELQRQGRIRHVGFSTHGRTDVIVQAIESDEFDYVNLHWYYVNPFTWPAVEAATRKDVGVFIISPNDKGGKLYEPSETVRQLCTPLTPMQFNDLYCLSQDQVHTLSLGAAQPSDFDEHVQGLAHWDQRHELTKAIDERLQSALIQQHGEEWASQWHEGLPDCSEIPGEINVHEILRLWTYGTALDLLPWAKMRYNLLGQGGHWFRGQNAATAGEINWAPLLVESPFATIIPERLRQAHELLVEAPVQRASAGD